MEIGPLVQNWKGEHTA